MPAACGSGATMQGRVRRVLVVEDDPLMRRSIIEAIGGEDYAVDSASTVADAEALIGADRLDLLIADRNLPDGSGETLARTVAQDGTPYILTSGTMLAMDTADSEGQRSNGEAFDSRRFLGRTRELMRQPA
jgi:CheY-like chemotaxis protein